LTGGAPAAGETAAAFVPRPLGYPGQQVEYLLQFGAVVVVHVDQVLADGQPRGS
jgi:hypothetical protein